MCIRPLPFCFSAQRWCKRILCALAFWGTISASGAPVLSRLFACCGEGSRISSGRGRGAAVPFCPFAPVRRWPSSIPAASFWDGSQCSVGAKKAVCPYRSFCSALPFLPFLHTFLPASQSPFVRCFAPLLSFQLPLFFSARLFSSFSHSCLSVPISASPA